MSEHRSSYRQIFKATSIFGGVQVYQILLSIVRSKLVAVLLGAQGMGISGLFLSVTTLISSLTGMGISVSAVRNISEAHQKGDEVQVRRVVSVVKKLALLTGILGAVVTLLLAPWLSEITFGDTSYTISFMALSITFILGSLASGQSVLLQGLRKLGYMAKSSILGATAGLLMSIPLYHVYGLQGIVPGIILSSVATAGFAYFFGSKLAVSDSKSVSFREAWQDGKGMIRMGIMLSLSTIIAAASAYAVRLYINAQGSMADVGLYSAGFSIMNTYVGMIFTAMATDYYPRLSAVAHDSEQSNELINQQTEMALLILGPILILFLIVLKFAITLLYTREFLASVEMVQWAVLAIFFRTLSWAMGFMFLSKGDSKVFFWNELVASVYTLALNILGYSYFGLEGLGLSFLVSYVLSVVQNFMLTNYKYKYRVRIELIPVFLSQLCLSIACLALMRQVEEPVVYLYVLPIMIAAIWYSWREINKRIDLIGLIRSKVFGNG